MAKEIRIPFTNICIGRFLFLLISIASVFLIRPFLEGYISLKILMDIFISFVMVSGLYAVSQKKGFLIIGLILFVPALLIHWGNYFAQVPTVNPVGITLELLFFIFVAVIILNHIFREKNVTADMIIGALCVYFLMGIIWAQGYDLLEMTSSGAFQNVGEAETAMPAFVYYSYVTLTTLGYGDITPVSPPARSLSMLEAITGQIYLTVLIARLVALHIAQSNHKDAN